VKEKLARKWSPAVGAPAFGAGAADDLSQGVGIGEDEIDGGVDGVGLSGGEGGFRLVVVAFREPIWITEWGL